VYALSSRETISSFCSAKFLYIYNLFRVSILHVLFIWRSSKSSSKTRGNIWSSSQKFSAACCYFLPLKSEHLPQCSVLKHMCLFDNISFSYYSPFLRKFVLFPYTKYTLKLIRFSSGRTAWSQIAFCITQATRVLYVPLSTRQNRTERRKRALRYCAAVRRLTCTCCTNCRSNW
jgi:hypothetical protein